MQPCYTIHTFPQKQGLWDELSRPAGSVMPEDLLLQLFFRLTSTMSTQTFCHALGLDGQQDEYKVFCKNGSALMPISGADNLKLLFAVGTCYQLATLFKIAVQTKSSNSSMSKWNKVIVELAAAFAPLLAVQWSGFNNVILYAASAIRYCIEKTAPVKISNMFGELEVVSRFRKFSWSDFAKRKLTAAMVFAGPIFYLVIKENFFNELGQEDNNSYIQFCPKENIYLYEPGKDSYSFAALGTLSFVAGIIATDMLVFIAHKVGLLNDPREPLGQFNPFQKTRYKPIITARTPFLEAVEPTKRVRANAAIAPIPQQLTTDSPISGRVEPRRKIEKNGPATEQTSQPEIVINHLALRTTMKLDEFPDLPLAPLSGSGVHNVNLWGVIAPDTQHHRAEFNKKLNSGTIGLGHSIQLLTTGAYELRHSGDSRIIGRLITGEDQVYRGICDIFGWQRAIELVKEMKGKCNEDLGLIIFSAVAAKHGDIARVANAFGR